MFYRPDRDIVNNKNDVNDIDELYKFRLKELKILILPNRIPYSFLIVLIDHCVIVGSLAKADLEFQSIESID